MALDRCSTYSIVLVAEHQTQGSGWWSQHLAISPSMETCSIFTDIEDQACQRRVASNSKQVPSSMGSHTYPTCFDTVVPAATLGDVDSARACSGHQVLE